MGRDGDDEMDRIDGAKGIDFALRSSGYFVHSQMEVNRHFQRKTPYLFHATHFPRELKSPTKLKPNSNEKNGRYRWQLGSDAHGAQKQTASEHFLFEEDERKMENARELNELMSRKSGEAADDINGGLDANVNVSNDNDKDIVETMEEYDRLEEGE